MGKCGNLRVMLSRTGRHWSTPEQELLLRAALLEGSEALDAWQEWQLKFDVDESEPETVKLLPMLYRNLGSHMPESPLTVKIKGVCSKTWFKNQKLFNDVSVILSNLRNSGIPIILLKEAALTIACYQDYSLCPIADFDIFIHSQQLSSAAELLISSGFLPVEDSGNMTAEMPAITRSLDFYTAIMDSCVFRNGAGLKINLHWHLLKECHVTDADDYFWRNAIPAKFADKEFFVLSPQDQLLHICLDGLKYNPHQSGHRMMDAAVCVRTYGAKIDWVKLGSLLRQYPIALPIKQALHYLHSTLHIPIPPEAFRDIIQNVPVSKTEAMEYNSKIYFSRIMGSLYPYFSYYFFYSSTTEHSNALSKLTGFIKFLQFYWKVDGPWQVLYCAVRIIVRKGLGKLAPINVLLKRYIKALLSRIFNIPEKDISFYKQIVLRRILNKPLINCREQLPFLLNFLNLKGEGVELGVWKGYFSKEILKNSNLSVLYSIDSWKKEDNDLHNDLTSDASQDEYEKAYEEALESLQQHGDRSRVMRKNSREASSLFGQETLDFVFIDANHSYLSCSQDIGLWWGKVKKGGIFAGHDYFDGVSLGMRYGAKSAVDEFMKRNHQKLFITPEREYSTWYLIKK